MEPTIKPIETVYQGYRFRSRLEARWAVFFDTAGIRWEYEKEGFELGDGARYLPDFYLSDYQCWIEIKGQEPSETERHKAGLLAAQTGNPVDIFCGDPWVDMRIFSYLSRMPEHVWPRVMDYIDLAMSCEHWEIVRALMRSNEGIYWGNVSARLDQARGHGLIPTDYGKPYREWDFARLEMCCKCGRLLWGTKEHIAHYPQYIGVKLDLDKREYRVVPAQWEDASVQVVEFERPETDPARPDFCPDCDDEDAEGDPQHPRLIAAYTAARQARFEHGERGRRS